MAEKAAEGPEKQAGSLYDKTLDVEFCAWIRGEEKFDGIEPLIARMTARGRGQIALMSSLASFVVRPGTEGYCASKAAVRVWGEGLRQRLGSKGVAVSVICPGFVDTPLTRRNRFPMPMLMAVEPAALLIKARLARDQARIAFPWPLYLGARLAGLLPLDVQRLATARWPGKE